MPPDEPPPSPPPTDLPPSDDADADDVRFPGAAPTPEPASPDAAPSSGDTGLKLPEGNADAPPVDPLFDAPPPAPAPAPEASVEGKTYYDLLRKLNLATTQLAIYPDRHPRVRELLEQTLAMLHGFLAHMEQLTLGLTEGKLFIEEQLMEETEAGVARFIVSFKKLEIDALSFLPEIELHELVALVKVMGLKPERVQAQGGVRTLLPQDAVPHIRMEKARYERVLEGQAIVSADMAAQALQSPDATGQPVTAEQMQQARQEVERQRTATSKKSLFEVLTDYLEGKMDDFPQNFDAKALVTEIQKNPRRMVALMLQVGRTIQSLQTVVERVGRWLATWAQTEGFRARVNPAEVMMELGKTLQQELLNPEAKDLAQQFGSMDSLGAMVSSFSDIIKTNLVVAKYQATRKKPSEFKKFVSSMMADESEKERLLPEIAKQLKEAGLSDDELHKLIEKVKETEVGEGSVKISRAELQRLYHMEEMAKKRLTMGGSATSAAASAPSAPTALPPEAVMKRSEVERIFAQLGARKSAVLARPDEKIELTEAELSQLRSKAEKLDWLLDRKEKVNLDAFIAAHRTAVQELDQINQLVSDLAQGVLVVDAAEKVVLMNRAAEDLLGVRMGEVIGRHVLERLGEEHVVALGRRAQTASGAVAIQQLEMAHAQPQRQTLKASTALVEDTHGRPVGMLFVLTDLQKQQELEQMKQQFVGRLKDELRTPLVALHDALILILSGTAGMLTEEQRRLASQAVEHAARLTHNVDALLDFSKVQRGEITLQRRPLPVEPFVQTTLASFESWAKEKSIRLEFVPSPQSLTMLGDATWLDRILSALIANAVNFTPEKGKVTVTVEPAETHTKTPAVQISVHDTGPGIPEAYSATVFEPFSAATGAGTGGTGMGLGLAVAKGIIEQHGGRIALDSELGVGSKFFFVIPLAPAAPIPPKS